jgi:flagellar basal-body rod protein FlgG
VERGLFIAASGMLADQIRQDVLANNLANATTAGYKGDRAVASAFSSLLLENIDNGRTVGPLGMGVRIDDIKVDGHQAGLRATQNPLDLAMAGPGFFAVQAPGGMRYTRDGAFALDADRRLVNAMGMPVLGDDGRPITLPPGERVTIDKLGRVSVDERIVATLRIDVLNPDSLRKQGDNLYTGAIDTAAAKGQVAQGFLEASNVNSVREMVGLITTMRSYEASTKAVRALDETVGKAVNEVGRP